MATRATAATRQEKKAKVRGLREAAEVVGAAIAESGGESDSDSDSEDESTLKFQVMSHHWNSIG